MKPRPSPTTQRALTRVEVLVVLSVIALLALIVIPMFRPRIHGYSPRMNCLYNLKQVGLAFRIWSGDNGDRFPMRVSVTNGGTLEWVASGTVSPHFQVMSNELNSPKVINCPTDATRLAANNWTTLDNTNINYFVGVDATEVEPAMLLAGDDNWTVERKPLGRGLVNLCTNSTVGWSKLRHQVGVNIAFADGSVQWLIDKLLRQALASTGVATNRLAMP